MTSRRGDLASRRSLPNGGADIPARSAAPVLGAVEWFNIGAKDRAERVLAGLGDLGISELRTNIFWSDWVRPEWQAWYDWLLPTLKRSVNILPCIYRTPPWLGIIPHESSPPRDPKAYADFIDVILSRYGELFDTVELWHDPQNPADYDASLDPGYERFCVMIGMAAHWLKRCGKRTVLCATPPTDLEWLSTLGRRQIFMYIDAVGIQGPPAHGWEQEIGRVRRLLHGYGSQAEVWITSAAYSTWRHDERGQLAAFLEAASTPVPRMYWRCVEDADPVAAPASALGNDADAHRGLYTSKGRPKLLARALAEGGAKRAREVAGLAAERDGKASPAAHVPGAGANGNGGIAGRLREPATLITGGAGFIGTNLADRLANSGRRVIIYDDLSRPGVQRNAEYLHRRHGTLVDIRIEDVRNRRPLRQAVEEADDVFHFAAQVAVTTSLDDPSYDFDVNAGGTVALLEEVRRRGTAIPVIFTSTNKVYGNLLDVELLPTAGDDRYEPVDPKLRTHGTSELRPLQFCSPYACSKGAADQYVLDYSASYGIPACVFRMSCIYGPHQCGNEDQGWIAHFLMRALRGEAITIYGDGRQVRDALFADDLVNAFLVARQNITRLSGRAFNIGGGPANSVSVVQVLETIGGLVEEDGRKCVPGPAIQKSGARAGALRSLQIATGPWRTGDQRWYVSDIRAFSAATGWAPQVRVTSGIQRLHAWLRKLPQIAVANVREGPGSRAASNEIGAAIR